MKTILIVDDHADIRKLIRLTLELDNYQIHEAADGNSAMRFMLSAQPDIVLLDVMMPGPLSGLDVCRRIKATPAFQAVRVVLLSARGFAKDREAGFQAGADEYLVKPFSPLQLIELLSEVPKAA